MIPTAANSDYPQFIADQVLTSDNLNDLFGYLDEQGRLSRTNLTGIGIVCGLQIKTAADGSSITITKGVAVTSQGYLISIPEVQYAYRSSAKFDAVKCNYYNKFVDVEAKEPRFDMWELKQKAEEGNTEIVTKTFLQDQGKIVALFVELLEENNKNCSPDSCDDKGVIVTLNVRPLLIPQAAVDNFLSNGSNINASTALILPELKMPRFDVPATQLLDTEDIMQAYLTPLSNEFVKLLSDKLTVAFTKLSSMLPDGNSPAYMSSLLEKKFREFSFLHDGSMTTGMAINLQYFYDFFSDLVQAYDELRLVVRSSVCACLPDEDLYPRHVLLGVSLGAVEGATKYRTGFMSSPILKSCAEDERAVKILLTRILSMLSNFKIPSADNNKAGIPLRITPSFLGPKPISEKAIPFYYKPNETADQLYLNWSPSRVRNHTENQVLSYNATDYNKVDDFVMQPLKYDLEPYNFLRIEGHIGKQFTTVVTALDLLKKENRLPFEVIALSSDTRSIFTLIRTIEDLEASGNIQEGFAEIMKHKACFADIFLALSSWMTRLKCCVKDQRKYYLGQFASVVDDKKMDKAVLRDTTGAVAASVANLATELKVEAAKQPYTIKHLYESKLNVGSMNKTFANEVFVNVATGKSTAADALVVMPYKLDRVAEMLPNHITELNVAELQSRVKELTDTGMQMSELYLGPNIKDKMPGVDLTDLQNKLKLPCLTCLMEELKALVKEFLTRLLALMVRQKLGYFTNLHPGIIHKAGVPVGGTFIVVYHEENPDDHQSVRDVKSAVNRIASVFERDAGKKMEAIQMQKRRTSFGTMDRMAEKYANTEAVKQGVSSDAMQAVAAPKATDSLMSNILLTDEINFLKQVKAVKEGSNPLLDDIVKSLQPGIVIADFYLPYICGSNCPPTQMLVVNNEDKPNQPPVARPGDAVSIQLPNNTVKLDGSASSDADGSIQTYLWEKKAGKNALIKQPENAITDVTDLEAGTYEFLLTVTDDAGANDKKSVAVTVLAKESKAPNAVAKAEPMEVQLGPNNTGGTTLSGLGSTAGTSPIATYQWAVKGSNSSTVIITSPNDSKSKVSFSSAGNYECMLTVKDQAGASDDDSVTVKVSGQTTTQKTCLTLPSIQSQFDEFRRKYGRMIPVFERGYPDYKSISEFFELMKTKDIASLPVNEQIKFFIENKTEFELTRWLKDLFPVIQRTSDFRILALDLLNILSSLVYFLACIQEEDIDRAEVKMMSPLSLLISGLKKFKENQVLLSEEDKVRMALLRAMTVAENDRVESNNESEKKKTYKEGLKTVIEILRS